MGQFRLRPVRAGFEYKLLQLPVLIVGDFSLQNGTEISPIGGTLGMADESLA